MHRDHLGILTYLQLVAYDMDHNPKSPFPKELMHKLSTSRYFWGWHLLTHWQADKVTNANKNTTGHKQTKLRGPIPILAHLPQTKQSFVGRETKPFSISRTDFLAARAPAPAFRLPNLLDPNRTNHSQFTSKMNCKQQIKNRHTHLFNSHLPGKGGLDSCTLEIRCFEAKFFRSDVLMPTSRYK